MSSVNKNERNKFLTEMMGLCWHKFPEDSSFFGPCLKCGWNDKDAPSDNIIFSTWEGFGRLWEWIQEQKCFSHFMWECDPFRKTIKSISGPPGRIWCINPDDFANAVYKYLKDK